MHHAAPFGNTFLDNILSILDKEVGAKLGTPGRSGGPPCHHQNHPQTHHTHSPPPQPPAGHHQSENNSPPPAGALHPPPLQQQHLVPNVDVHDVGGAYDLVIEAPGVSKETIEVRITNPRTLMVSFVKARRHEPEAGEDGAARPTMREVQYGTYMRGLMFKSEIDCEGVRARYENGQILVSLPKRVSSAVGRRIEVE